MTHGPGPISSIGLFLIFAYLVISLSTLVPSLEQIMGGMP